MSDVSPGPWLALAGLGAYHGLNPAMGWLFAVALGLQERKRSAVFKALPAIAIVIHPDHSNSEQVQCIAHGCNLKAMALLLGKRNADALLGVLGAR